MKRFILAFGGTILLVTLLLASLPHLTLAAPPDPDPKTTTAPDFAAQSAGPALAQSLDAALAGAAQQTPLYGMYDMGIDHVEYSDDGATALVYLAPLDPETGEMLGTEPLLAVAHLDTEQKTPGPAWDISLQSSADWSAELLSLPEGLLDDNLRERYLETDPQLAEKSTSAVTGTFGGYLLPWAGGVTKRLTMGAYHTSCLSACQYAFDFADGSMFPLLAAKGGTVYHWYDGCPNGSTDCTNSLTIQDTSTNPTTYQIYMHLRQGSIPDSLKNKGTPVNQGTYVGDVDDTGFSSGHHLHFMVVANPYLSSSGYIWGTSVDITFRDVSVNWDSATQGGRPCLTSDIGHGKCTEAQIKYTSQNSGANPPTGSLIAPSSFQTVTGPTLTVAGSGTDNIGVTRLQMLANTDGSWREVGPSQTSNPFSFDLDLCASSIPDGPFSLALRVWDYEGNQSVAPLDIRYLVKDYPCPSAAPTTCSVGANQVGLFADANYAGACKVFDIGEYNYQSLGAVGNDNAASVKVGANVQAVLFDGTAFEQRTETLAQSDPNLADNRLIQNRVSSVKVQNRASKPLPPVVENPWAAGLASTVNQSIVLAWDSTVVKPAYGGGAVDYKVSLSGPAGYTPPARSEWSPETTWSLGSLPAGTYTFRVWGRGTTGLVSDPSPAVTFTVNATPVVTISGEPRAYLPLLSNNGLITGGTPASLPWVVPHEENLENGTAGWMSSGYWNLASTEGPSGATSAWISSSGNYLGVGLASAGDLTSPPISIPAEGAWLRFDYRYQTEDANPNWDQRRVQLSVDDGPFEDVLQLSGEVMNTWLTSPAIALTDAKYAGHSVRVRFHQNPIDVWSNGNITGWAIDNLRLTQDPPPVCSDPLETTPGANDLYNGAGVAEIQVDQTLDGQLCPFGDVDYYKFTAGGTLRLGVNLDAASLSPASALDSVVTLFDSDGHSVLAENDDEVAQVRNDSALSFTLPNPGTYYLRVKAWDTPTSGGPNYNYRLQIFFDNNQPSAPAVAPGTNGFLPGNGSQLSATVTDAESGISHVAFYWHANDWSNGGWSLVGEDWAGTDGWSVPYNLPGLPETTGFAVYALAYDWGGNVHGSAAWNVGIDRTPPTITVGGLPAINNSTAVPLRWSAADNLAGIDHYLLDKSVNGGNWEATNLSIPGANNGTWFVGDFGATYAFRVRAVDRAGNLSAEQATAPVVVAASCTGDAFEAGGDNDFTHATPLVVDAGGSVHTFCNKGDVDWYRVNVVAGQTYVVSAIPETGSPAAARLKIYQPDGSTLIAGADASSLGSPVSTIWTATASGTVLIRAESIDPNVAGDGVTYQVSIGRNRIYLPILQR